ncbi:hypothetical protein [Agarivorans sp. 1_MG-2023]|uniref:hypothetical protein n=1 Tax=Agarivorans sp. 1_MG-2023 TaxID=3062634 RepID=UPI0026E3920B|nr:hypothetical protein [Agarivorans sp. 1_MG-2023]MDO6765521.1 hypothetical protein [Agarivorans sp. 1_MG-2023]
MKSPLQIGIVFILVLIMVVTYKLKSVGEPNVLPYLSYHTLNGKTEVLAQQLVIPQTERTR